MSSEACVGVIAAAYFGILFVFAAIVWKTHAMSPIDVLLTVVLVALLGAALVTFVMLVYLMWTEFR
ncbi:MAG: hypothetical protein ACI360_08485 [Atopobiaceae bacterium]